MENGNNKRGNCKRELESNTGEEIATLKAKLERFERMLQAMKNEIYVIRSKTGV